MWINQSMVKTSRGFTLIEVMIVMMVMMLLAAVVAPLAFEELAKSKAKVEFMSLKNTLKIMTTKAFTSGQPYRVTMTEQTLLIRSAKGEQVIEYKDLRLPKVSFFINANGFPSLDVITIKVGNQQRQLSYEDVLGVKRDKAYAQ